MERLLSKRKTALILAIAAAVCGAVSVALIVIFTINFEYVPLIVSILVFTAAAYLIPIFIISFYDCGRMAELIQIMEGMSCEEREENVRIKELMRLKNQKYTDKLIEKIKKGGYLS